MDYVNIALAVSILPFVIKLTRSITQLNDTMKENNREHRRIFKTLNDHETRIKEIEVFK